MKTIKVAIAGVGNCASSLVQGVEYYRQLRKNDENYSEYLSGLMNYEIAGYYPDDIEFVVAFDIDARKVGKPLHEAIFSKPNCAKIFQKRFSAFGNKAEVFMGEILDGVAHHLDFYPEEKRFVIADEKPCNVAEKLEEYNVDVLINYVPVGAEKASKFYAECALKTRTAFINCVPVFVASDDYWAKKFFVANIPIIGDDVKSQIGATIIHRVLAKLFEDRGIRIKNTYQLNFGGNTDFLNMLDKNRLVSKKISKTEAVQSQLQKKLMSDNIHIGPSDYVSFLNDNKICFIKLEGEGFGGLPINLELKLSVEDSPNSAGVVIDAIRCVKHALDLKIGGPLLEASAYFMKHPPKQYSDEEARVLLEKWIREDPVHLEDSDFFATKFSKP